MEKDKVETSPPPSISISISLSLSLYSQAQLSEYIICPRFRPNCNQRRMTTFPRTASGYFFTSRPTPHLTPNGIDPHPEPELFDTLPHDLCARVLYNAPGCECKQCWTRSKSYIRPGRRKKCKSRPRCEVDPRQGCMQRRSADFSQSCNADFRQNCNADFRQNYNADFKNYYDYNYDDGDDDEPLLSCTTQ